MVIMVIIKSIYMVYTILFLQGKPSLKLHAFMCPYLIYYINHLSNFLHILKWIT